MKKVVEHGWDFEILEMDEGFQVWIPDESGACLGDGRTKIEAIIDAIFNTKIAREKLVALLIAELK